jgi:hypothetical protein
MSFVVVPSGTDPEGSTTKAIFVVILFISSIHLGRMTSGIILRRICERLILL